MLQSDLCGSVRATTMCISSSSGGSLGKAMLDKKIGRSGTALPNDEGCSGRRIRPDSSEYEVRPSANEFE